MQVTAGKDLYVSETTSLVADGATDPTGSAGSGNGAAAGKRRRGTGLSGMLLPELQRLATELGIAGTGRMRKGDLVSAIEARQVDSPARAEAAPVADAPSVETPAQAVAEAPAEAPAEPPAAVPPRTES
ncbi:MAG: rho, partial [Klenkia sp.]|nr:rho [Klenkia sp.]